MSSAFTLRETASNLKEIKQNLAQVHTAWNVATQNTIIPGSVLSTVTAIAKYHRLGGLYNRNIFLTVLETRKSKIKVKTRQVPF